MLLSFFAPVEIQSDKHRGVRGNAPSVIIILSADFRMDIQCLSPAKKHVTQNGNPDWTYMEAYMSKVMHECEESLTNLTNIVSDGGVDAFLELN